MNFSKSMYGSQIRETENGFAVTATPGSNSFVDPSGNRSVFNAPFYYEEIEGDFTFRAKVRLDFVSTYDAAVLFAYENDSLWAKACFEYTDLGTHAVVSVMTNEYSDDANGVNIDGSEVWLQLARQGDVFAIHYSLDGEDYRMARLTRLPMSATVKVGILAQSPIGQGGDRFFEHLSFVRRAPESIRAGK